MVNDLEPVIYVIDRRGLEATVIIIIVVAITATQRLEIILLIMAL